MFTDAYTKKGQVVVEHECDFCHTVIRVFEKDLTLGLSTPTMKGPDVMPLPACACGARETLNRTTVSLPKDLPNRDKRVLINAVAEHLKKIGQVDPECLSLYANENPAVDSIGVLREET